MSVHPYIRFTFITNHPTLFLSPYIIHQKNPLYVCSPINPLYFYHQSFHFTSITLYYPSINPHYVCPPINPLYFDHQSFYSISVTKLATYHLSISPLDIYSHINPLYFTVLHPTPTTHCQYASIYQPTPTSSCYQKNRKCTKGDEITRCDGTTQITRTIFNTLFFCLQCHFKY
jgi:hypothetical protein